MSIYSFPEPRYISGAGCSQSIDMNMGLASDVCVATRARSTGAGRLAGRPGPHGRRGLQTADVAYGMSRSSSRGEVFLYGLA